MDNVFLALISMLALINILFAFQIMLVRKQISFLQKMFTVQIENFSRLKDDVKTLQIIEKIKKETI